jgi:hypothetical protein
MALPFSHLFRPKQEMKLPDFFAQNFSPMSVTLPEDIFIAGYPKSGNSWFQDLIAGLVFGILSDKSHPKLVNDLVPDLHDDTFYRRYQTPTFFKTHFKPVPQYRNVVYLLRDGRDAMVSYWHHRAAMEGKEIDFLKMARDGEGLFPCKWEEHVNAWMANPYQARMIVIKYEDLLKDAAVELERFCVFSGLPVDPDHISAIANRASFAKLRAREQRLGETSELWPKDKLFRRRGVAGSFRDEMPPDVLEAFLAGALPTLEKHGYAM